MKLWSNLKNLPQELWILFFSVLVNRTGTMVLPFLVVYLTKGLKFTPGRAGLVLAVYGGTSLLAAPMGGKLSDRLGAIRVMKTALVLSGALLLVFPFVQSFVWVVLLTFFWSLTTELFRPASLAVITDLVGPEQRKAAFAIIRLAINLGMSIGPAVAGFLVAVSFSAIFWIDGVTSLLAGMVLAIAPWRTAAKIARSEESSMSEHKMLRQSRSILRDYQFLFFLLSVIPIGVVFFQHEAAMALYVVRDLRLPAYIFGLLFTFNTLVIVLIEVPLNTAMSNCSHRLTLVLGSVLTALGFGALVWAREPFGLAATVLIWTFGEMILFPGMSAYVAEVAPEERRGEYMGYYIMAFGLAFTIGPWAGTVVLERFGAATLWTSMFFIGAISAGMMSRVQTTAMPLPVASTQPVSSTQSA